jgi:hypothetical protein
MYKNEATKLIVQGKYAIWNDYRKRNPNWRPDLSDLDVSHMPSDTLELFDLTNAILCGTKFRTDIPSYQCRLNAKEAIFDVDTIFPHSFNPLLNGLIFKTQKDIQKETASESITIFISYAWVDDNAVLAIDQWLRNKNLNTKMDKRDFFAGSRIRSEVLRVMKDCNVILIFYSKNSKDKPWPEFERELAEDLEMEAKKEKKSPPRIIYLVVDETPLPNITEKNRLAIFVKGKRFELVCEELYHHILQIERKPETIDLDKWKNYTF